MRALLIICLIAAIVCENPFFCIIGNQKIMDVAKNAFTLVKEKNWVGLLFLVLEKFVEVKNAIKECLNLQEDEPILMGFCTMCSKKICRKVFC